MGTCVRVGTPLESGGGPRDQKDRGQPKHAPTNLPIDSASFFQHPPRRRRRCARLLPLPPYRHNTHLAIAMIAIQKPVNALFSTPQAYRPTHGRHPSAPVVVRPTHTPGLLSLSKPANVASSRPQLAQAQPRAHKSSTPKKANRPPQAPQATLSVQESKKSSAPKSDKTQITSASPERSARGRQNKPAPIDNKADKR